uniref:programmed cell death protein 2-like n=1 Tax=Euleptes europaea TaxID=460621 RepID=UPI00253F8601|nr:programmed cell death protein 2-like [Euleptes europaea]
MIIYFSDNSFILRLFPWRFCYSPPFSSQNNSLSYKSQRALPSACGRLSLLARLTHVGCDGRKVPSWGFPLRTCASCPMSASRPPPVLLGLCDAAVPAAAASSCQSRLRFQGVASKLGGAPDHVPLVTLARPFCGICRAGLMHVVQLYCPLEGSPFHRVLSVFACAMKSCWGKSESWKVLRSQYLEVQGKEMQDCKPKQKQESLVVAKDWCDGADDWGEDSDVALSQDTCCPSPGLLAASDPFPGEGDCASRLQGLSLQEASGISHLSCSDNPTGEEQNVPMWQPYYISAVEEEDCLAYNDTDHAQKLLKEYQQREGVDLEQLMSESNMAESCGEKYEKSDVEKRGEVFHKFMKRIAPCQEQILRYSWGGQPLLITRPSTDIKAVVPPCGNCQSKRIFEFQLMPALVSVLKCGDEDLSVEFGTALVYTCEKSCWPTNHSAPLEEFIFVQEDPDQKLFK